MMAEASPCRDWELYLDQDLSLRQRAEFEEHLAHCLTCQQRVNAWQTLEHEIQAAALLFSDLAFVSSTLENSERVVAAPVQTLTRTSRDGPAQNMKTELNRDRRWSHWRTRRTIIIGAVLLLASGWSWWSGLKWLSGSDPSGLAARLDTETSAANEPGTTEVDSTEVDLSKISIQVQTPSIASDPQTTKNYTFIQVYPAFKVLDFDSL